MLKRSRARVRPIKRKLTQNELKALLFYDPKTDTWTWLVKSGRAEIGKIAGYTTTQGKGPLQRWIVIHRRPWKMSHLVFLWHTGRLPYVIKHQDGDYMNCRFENLIELSKVEEIMGRRVRSDSSTGHRGIYWDYRREKYVARIMINRVNHHLGSYRHLDDAVAARVDAEGLVKKGEKVRPLGLG
jgi:hypothetical protein